VLLDLTVFDMLGAVRAVKAADRYRRLRSIGVTVTRTTDVIIGSFCIDNDLPLLYDDRGFDPMVQHLKLRPALPRA
jgi:predicted nucleic acid-binding protein